MFWTNFRFKPVVPVCFLQLRTAQATVKLVLSSLVMVRVRVGVRHGSVMVKCVRNEYKSAQSPEKHHKQPSVCVCVCLFKSDQLPMCT